MPWKSNLNLAISWQEMVDLTVYIVSAVETGGCSRVGQQCENGRCERVKGLLTCRCNVGFINVNGDCRGKVFWAFVVES